MRIKLNASYIFNFQQFPEHYPRNDAAKLNKKRNNTTPQGKMLQCKSRIYLGNSYKTTRFSYREGELKHPELCFSKQVLQQHLALHPRRISIRLHSIGSDKGELKGFTGFRFCKKCRLFYKMDNILFADTFRTMEGFSAIL